MLVIAYTTLCKCFGFRKTWVPQSYWFTEMIMSVQATVKNINHGEGLAVKNRMICGFGNELVRVLAKKACLKLKVPQRYTQLYTKSSLSLQVAPNYGFIA